MTLNPVTQSGVTLTDIKAVGMLKISIYNNFVFEQLYMITQSDALDTGASEKRIECEHVQLDYKYVYIE